MAAESAVKVCVRVRPVVAREEKVATENAQPFQIFWETDQKSIRQIDDGTSNKCFSFDRVFNADESTIQLYQDIAKPLVVSSVEGYNGTIFAYGQTSSGKTFTMMGCDSNPGVIPLAVDEVFQTIKTFQNKEFLLRVSYMEIYNETVTDLLVDSWKRKPLEIREMMNKTIYVADLTEEVVTSSSQSLAWIRKGEKNRHYGKTKMNQRSSRSHTIFRMILESRERSDPASGENADGAIIVSHLNLVDLAGSERASQTGAEGTRLKEGCNINLSLFTLGQVIKKLTDENQKGFTNYRDSKLTRILQNSLGGNAKTVIISTITPVSLEETLSTLQFASTAKKMKNDPHVTEVSDDGALLKRYRNEIVDLKRRLNEVSLVTQTTVTEKEVLSQLLQEKDQLQREQEDRIRNLTKLLVTGSNPVNVPKVPKRRVTWGGQRIQHDLRSACDDDAISDMNETFNRKRKADSCSSMPLYEADEDFFPHWGIPEEPSDESSETVRSFGDSDLASPGQISALSEKMAHLNLQLQIESQQKEEAVKKLETLEGRVAELQLQLQSEALHKEEAVEKNQATEGRLAQVELLLQDEAKEKTEALHKMQTMEQRFGELETLLQNETQHKLDALLQMQAAEERFAELEKVLETVAQQKRETTAMLEIKVREPQRQLEEQRHSESNQMRRGFAESVQLCETFAFEKEILLAERDHLKQELGMFLEQTQSLEEEKAALVQELKEKKDLEEFKSLELDVMKENENELQKEISDLKKAVESSEHERFELQMSLTATKETMEAELNALKVQLEMGSSRDLHQELNVATDDVNPESRVGSLSSMQREPALCGDISPTLVEEQMDNLTRQIGELTEELQLVKKTKDDLQSGQSASKLEAERLQDLLEALKRENAELKDKLGSCAEKEKELKQHCADVTQQLSFLQAEQQQRDSEMSQFTVSLEQKDTELKQMIEALKCVEAEKDALLLERSAAATSSAEEAGNTEVLLRNFQQELREEKQRNSDLMRISAEKDAELKENMLRFSGETQDGPHSSTEVNRLLSVVASLTAERDQLRQDLQENVEMMIENQEELRSVLAKNGEQAKQIKLLKCESVQKRDGNPSGLCSELEESQTSVKVLTEELQSVKEQLLSERESLTEKLEKLQREVTAVSKENDHRQQEELEKLREEKKNLQAQLEENIQMMTVVQEELSNTRAERDSLLSENATEHLGALQSSLSTLTEERDQLQEMVEGLREEKTKLRAELEEKIEMVQFQQLISAADPLNDQQVQLEEVKQMRSVLQENDKLMLEKQEELKVLKENRQRLEEEILELKSQMMEMQSSSVRNKQMAEVLECLKEERESLLVERTTISHHFMEQKDELQRRLAAVGQERDKLREELGAELQRRTQMLEAEVGELNVTVETLTEQKKQLEEQASSTEEIIKTVKDELLEQKTFNSELKKTSEKQKCSLEEKIVELSSKLESVEAERNSLVSENQKVLQTHREETENLQMSLMGVSQRRDALQKALVELREEKEQLHTRLQENINVISVFKEKLTQQELLMIQKQTEREEQEAMLQQQVQNLQEELQLQRKTRAVAEAETQTSQQSSVSQQLNNLEQKPSTDTETLSHLQDSINQLNALFGEFQKFAERCIKYNSEEKTKVLKVQCSLKPAYLTSLPKSGRVAYGDVCRLGSRTSQSFTSILGRLRAHAVGYVKTFEEVLKKDVAVFEERQLQNLLLCRVDSPKFSVSTEHFQSVLNQRLTELLDKRLFIQQKLESLLESLRSKLTSYLAVQQAEILERVKFNEAVEATINPPVLTELERVLSQEVERRRSVVENENVALQVIGDELLHVFEEVKQLDAQIDSELREEKRKSCALLQALEGAVLTDQWSLLNNYKQLALQLQQAELGIKTLRKQLEEAEAEANNMRSSHKQVLQLLQTELLDAQVLVKEKENEILTLKVELKKEPEKKSSHAAELDNLQRKLFEKELKLTYVTGEHQQELERLKMVLGLKEESLRKLKRELRTQQQGEESFCMGKEIHARLTKPRGVVIQSSALLEKTELEKKVKQLQLRITELESLVSSQQAETNKWKTRAISLKGESKEPNHHSPPQTPKKRGLSTTSDCILFSSPTKSGLVKEILESPLKAAVSPWKPTLLSDSPKTSFFDGSHTERPSTSPPKQFFDNSDLGITPDAAAGSEQDDWRKKDYCNTQ